MAFGDKLDNTMLFIAVPKCILGPVRRNQRTVKR